MRILLNILLCLVSGCSIAPSDLRFTSVSLINASVRPELITINYDYVDHQRFYDGLGMLQTRVVYLNEYHNFIKEAYKPGRVIKNKDVLEVTFDSDVNLMKDYVSLGYTMLADAFYCNGLSRRPALDYGSVFMQRVDLSDTVVVSELMSPYAKKYQYQIYLRVRGDGFDLEKQPQDVCFVINGGRMWRDAYESNTVVVPQLSIEKAIHKDLM